MHRPVRVLLAEDNPEHQHAAALMLSGDDATLDTAGSGKAAVEMAARRRYDVILMDVDAPAVDGVEAAAAIRAAETASEDEPVPIVAFTSHRTAGLRERCLAAGMSDVLAAPIGSRELAEAVLRFADRRPAVLIADDSFEVRQFVRQRLRDTPCRLVAASDGTQAIHAFDRQPLCLVLLDMNMPVLDGYATAAAIRARDDGRAVPIVALTASEDDDVRARAAAAGCDLHVVKPVDARLLLSIVEAALDGDGPAAVVRDDQLPAGDSAEPLLQVEPFMADLVPEYVREKRRQVRDLRRLLETGDLDGVRRVAHDLKGTGAAYGIPDVTRLGRALESASRRSDVPGAAVIVEELDALLVRVQQQLGA
jgi:CheY-like chemotaxis protein/HPt (histidine-containing phosphotransfer) domain-containing protein